MEQVRTLQILGGIKAIWEKLEESLVTCANEN